MKNNKMRIALTGFSIGWGMFILVVLLGSSGGFQRGLYKTFHLDIDQIVRVSTGKSAYAWQGLDKGREIKLRLSDSEAIESSHIEHIERVCPMNTKLLEIKNGSAHVNTSVTGCYGGYLVNDYRTLTSGRDFNKMDIESHAKVCMMNELLARQLFQNNDPIGEYVGIDGIEYLVVGVCESSLNNDVSLAMYIPLSTMMTIYYPEGYIKGINLIVSRLDSKEHNEHLVREVHNLLASRLSCSPDDYKGIKVNNPYEQVLSAKNMIAGIGVFVWIIGLATLIAGIVGVSNIMLITVKERTRELGVRKAMGASNAHIISLVLIESVVITVIFGYLGMMIGVGLTQLLDMALGSAFPMFQNPVVQFWPIMGCNVIMIIAGLIAGYVPAKRAVSIKLVEALTS
ncbi:MAG: ABC transporter permease [Bacteroidales bacterium]|nr:ABC transporter permease [Bacteroidales bacterium]